MGKKVGGLSLGAKAGSVCKEMNALFINIQKLYKIIQNYKSQ